MNDWLEEQEFYELMQEYRHSPITDQPAVIKAFEAVKCFIYNKVAINKQFLEETKENSCVKLSAEELAALAISFRDAIEELDE